MIKINLIEQKKSLKIPVVLGIDLTKINYKFLAFALAISFVPEKFIFPRFDSISQEEEQKILAIQKESKSLTKRLRENKGLQKKIDDTEKKISELKLKTRQIEKILKIKTNPKPALERVAKDIPMDLWLTSLALTESQNIIINGLSYSFKSISNFLSLINDSKFFNRSLGVSDSKTLVEKFRGKKRRVESFSIKGKMNVYGGNR
jgi:hypothetical protein